MAPGSVGRSARERHPDLAPSFVDAAELLDRHARPELAGLLLLAFIERELRRAGLVDPGAQRLATRAAGLLARGRAGTLGAGVALAAGDPATAAACLTAAGQPAAARQVQTMTGRRPLGAHLPGLVRVVNESVTPDPSRLAGELRRPLRYLEQHGERPRALDLATALGWHRVAARLAREQRQPALAAEHWTRAGAPLEAGKAWLEAGRDALALEQLVQVPLDHPRHRTACVLAARVAGRAGVLPFELHHLLGPFLRSPPRDEAEVQALVELAGLYADQGMERSAIELLDGLLTARPHRDDLAQQRDALRRRLHDPGRDDALIAQDASFHGRLARQLGPEAPLSESLISELPELPPLPELPELPDLPGLQAPIEALRDQPAAPTLAPQQTAPAEAALPRGATLIPGEPRPPAGATMRTATLPPEVLPGQAPPTLVAGDSDPGPARGADTYADSLWSGTSAGRLPSSAPGTRALDVFRTGATIADRYTLRSILGEGGMGAVYRAKDQELGEEIALKVLTVPVRSPRTIERFRMELRLARRLTHPNIVRLHDIGVHEGFRYITMELLEGADLRRRLEEGVGLRRGIELAVLAARALQAAHDQDIVHRDVKPENLFVLDRGALKIMDFGLARTDGDGAFDETGMMAGTPAYMAPEQATDFARAGAPADQYALGVVCYELVTGSLPFRHAELDELLRMHREDPPVPPTRRRADLPAALDRAILRALDKDPPRRFPSCDAFADALEDCLG